MIVQGQKIATAALQMENNLALRVVSVIPSIRREYAFLRWHGLEEHSRRLSAIVTEFAHILTISFSVIFFHGEKTATAAVQMERYLAESAFLREHALEGHSWRPSAIVTKFPHIRTISFCVMIVHG